MGTAIVLRKAKSKIRVENKFGLHLADVSSNDTEFYEPVTESELMAVVKVVKDFALFHENIIEE